MSFPNVIVDGRLMWIEVPKKGSPSPWSPGMEYVIGDTVIPTSGVVVPSEKVDTMFQVVGYCGKTGVTAPVFPTVDKESIIDGQLILTCRSKLDDPAPIAESEFYVIERSIQVN